MIAYRYCSDKELDSLNRKDKIKGHHYENDDQMNTHIYEAKQKYLHFYLDSDNVYNFDPIKPENLVEFIFPNDFDNFRGIGYYYGVDENGNISVRYANQLAIPDYLIKRDQVKNIESLNETQFNENIKKLTRHGA